MFSCAKVKVTEGCAYHGMDRGWSANYEKDAQYGTMLERMDEVFTFWVVTKMIRSEI